MVSRRVPGSTCFPCSPSTRWRSAGSRCPLRSARSRPQAEWRRRPRPYQRRTLGTCRASATASGRRGMLTRSGGRTSPQHGQLRGPGATPKAPTWTTRASGRLSVDLDSDPTASRRVKRRTGRQAARRQPVRQPVWRLQPSITLQIGYSLKTNGIGRQLLYLFTSCPKLLQKYE